eukprot:105592_1
MSSKKKKSHGYAHVKNLSNTINTLELGQIMDGNENTQINIPILDEEKESEESPRSEDDEDYKQTMKNISDFISPPNVQTDTTEDKYREDDLESSSSDSNIEYTISRTLTTMLPSYTIQEEENINKDPKMWDYDDVKTWLNNIKLYDKMEDCFKDGATSKEGVGGKELLGLTVNKLFDPSGPYKATERLKGLNENESLTAENAEYNTYIKHFFQELTKLQILANSQNDSFVDKQSTVYDVIEIKRRIHLFIEKWDRILWIEVYVDKYDELPTTKVLSEELGVSTAIAEVYLVYFNDMDRLKKKDINELLLDFNVYNDCIIWWFIIIKVLTTEQTE